MSGIQVAKNDMQREAFLYFIDDFPRVIRSVTEFPADEVCHRAMILADTLIDFEVPADMTDIDRAILKAAIEKSDWLNPYEGQSEVSRNRKPEQMRTLRACAANLEAIGIEVNFLPD